MSSPRLPASIIPFLTELRENNNRPWFAAQKARYEQVKTDFEVFFEEVISATAAFDPGIGHLKPKDCTFRIYRDTRFSKDPSPYKTYTGAYLAKGGKKSPFGGYYLHIEPGAHMIAGGIHVPEKEVLRSIREGILNHWDEFRQIVENPDFKAIFPELPTEKLKKAPVGFSPDFEGIEYIKLKEFTVFQYLTDAEAESDLFFQRIVHGFRTMKPFLDFLNRSLEEAW